MMKFEEFLMESYEQKSRRIVLEEEVEELQQRLNGELKLKSVLRYALKRPVLSCHPLPSLLPLKVKTLLVELEMLENEIAWFEAKLRKLKIRLYTKKKLNKDSELMHARKSIQEEREDVCILSPFCRMPNPIIFSKIHV